MMSLTKAAWVVERIAAASKRSEERKMALYDRQQRAIRAKSGKMDSNGGT